MDVRCAAFLGMSIDGLIAGPNDELDWLDEVESVEGQDYGYHSFISDVDALVMGRRTFETVMGLVEEWPWDRPVVVMSRSGTELPEIARDAEVFAGTPEQLISLAQQREWSKLYVDGGRLVASFLNAGLLDELTVTILPTLRGVGVSVVGGLELPKWLQHVSTRTYENGMVQISYRHAVAEDESE